MNDDVDLFLDTEARTGIRWRYIRAGRVTHALTGSLIIARCGYDPWPEVWHGTGAPAHAERAVSLPQCGRCLRVLAQRREAL